MDFLRVTDLYRKWWEHFYFHSRSLSFSLTPIHVLTFRPLPLQTPSAFNCSRLSPFVGGESLSVQLKGTSILVQSPPHLSTDALIWPPSLSLQLLQPRLGGRPLNTQVVHVILPFCACGFVLCACFLYHRLQISLRSLYCDIRVHPRPILIHRISWHIGGSEVPLRKLCLSVHIPLFRTPLHPCHFRRCLYVLKSIAPLLCSNADTIIDIWLFGPFARSGQCAFQQVSPFLL